MPLIGQLLRHRRAGEARSAWRMSNLQGPESLELRSSSFADGGALPGDCVAKRIGGANLSPQLSWDTPPDGTAQLLLAVEDYDVPRSRPLIHCLATIEPTLATGDLPAGALAMPSPASGVRLMRSFIGRGWKGPEPIKGHGSHRYVFELYALGRQLPEHAGGRVLERMRPHDLLEAVRSPVLARGRLTGTYER